MTCNGTGKDVLVNRSNARFAQLLIALLKTLQTHSRRKHKISIGKRSRKVKNLGLDSAEYRPCLSERTRTSQIAPRPSYLHLNAALALSELSSSQKVSLKVNRGIQKDFERQA
ncbi:hypothetical protein TCAL_16642 [Tigriopus californicus]|uniref:Uncharacterized protein n=1 Tax=Tigriopus californicus TaxID=6832 RepID=A0A553NDR9_TIGCA|nr:hypothetical protein TCAL_16642 [Tigriopus californicus]